MGEVGEREQVQRRRVRLEEAAAEPCVLHGRG